MQFANRQKISNLSAPAALFLYIPHKNQKKDLYIALAKGDSPLYNPGEQTMIKSARADREKICVLRKALFCRNTLCIARKSDKIRAEIFRE